MVTLQPAAPSHRSWQPPVGEEVTELELLGWGWREGMFGGKAWPGEKVKGGVSARGVLFLWVCVAHRVPALASAVTV